ncbi:phenylacetate--CoA ligase family protein [Pendulispora albinea]|uniref:Phenylacetate--CoA ligase family protein n=1 Tax=Pendulispora albinea TaxID=2741071 RepID=A0ABZ2M9D3_9BACT
MLRATESAPASSNIRVDLYGQLFRSILWPTWESRIRRRPTMARYEFLERTQWRSLDELNAMQTGALRRLIRHAYTQVPLYRQRFREAGLTDADIQGPEDLHKIPVLTREDARERPSERESMTHPFPTIRKNTGGTTGQPLLFGYDADSEYWRQAIKLRGYGWAGYQPGDRALYFWGSPSKESPFSKTRAKILLDRAMRREIHVPCTVMDERDMRHVVSLIQKSSPKVIVCYTQAGAELARFINERQLRTWGTIPVLCGAERLFPADRLALERAFGRAVFETYGCREVMLIASECEAHEGLHVSMENILVEILVTEPDGTQRPANEGETGEVVLTDLHNLGMPFIRYKNGDLATAGPKDRCPCGRNLTRIAKVEGRAADLLRGADGTFVSGLAFHILFTGLANAARQFQVVQHPDRSVTLRIVPGDGLNDGSLEDIRRGCAKLLKELPLKIEMAPEIPLTKEGKRRTVIVEAP